MNEINIASSLLESINSIFSNLLSSIDTHIYSILDDLIFISDDLVSTNYFLKLLGDSSGFGIISICNSLLYGFLLYYGLSLLLSYLTFSQVQRPSSFIFKIFLCIVFVNSTKLICFCSFYVTSFISSSIRNIGEILFGKEICFFTLIEDLNSSLFLNSSNFNLFTFDGLIKAFISIGFINLAISYSLRYIMILVFSLICPFAILCSSIDKFSWIFKSWLKIFLSLLFLQILVAIILLITFSLDYVENDTFSQLIYIGSIYSLIKANFFIKDLMGGLSTDVNFGINTIKNLILGGG